MMLLGAWAYKITHVTPLRPDFVRQDNQPDPVFVGKVIGMKDCRWVDGSLGTFAEASVPLNREYALSSGLLEIAYTSGARVILEGPCRYTVDSQVGGCLKLGKLTARVENTKPQAANPEPRKSSLTPHPSPHFFVTTPTAVVTDLGTEFGIEVTDNGRTTTAVFVGEVRLETIGSNGKSGVSRVLTKNQSGVVEPNDNTVFIGNKDDAKSFVRVMPQPEDTQEANAYAQLVLSLDPVAYYRMERPADGANPLVVVDSTSGRRHGRLHGAGRDSDLARLWNAGRFGDALRLRGEFFGDYVTAPSLPSTDSNQLSCSVWVYLENTDSRWPHIVAEGGGKTHVRFKLALREYSGCPCGRVTTKTGEYRELDDEAAKPLPLRQWQHLAMVADGSNVKLYRNGVETVSMPCNGVSADPLGGQLLIGCANMATEPEEMLPDVFWDGRIDELAVFHRALSPDEITRLHEGPAGQSDDGVPAALDKNGGKEASE